MGMNDCDKYRLKLGYRLILFGIVLVVVLICILVFGAWWDDASDIVSVVGLLTSVLGALVGTFFGVQAGAEGKSEALRKLEKAKDRLVSLAGTAGEDAVKRARELDPKAWD